MSEIDCIYHVIRFPLASGASVYTASAWAYERGVLVSTVRVHDTYTSARTELDEIAAKRGLRLRWFDGAYRHERDLLVPDDGAPCR